MARKKRGINYFPVDVDIFENKKMVLLGLQYRELGEIIYIRLLALIYKNGYYLKISLEDLSIIMARQLNSRVKNINRIQEVLAYLAEIDLIDKNLCHEGVITSRGIQEQYQASTKRRGELIERDYWLLENDDTNNVLIDD